MEILLAPGKKEHRMAVIEEKKMEQEMKECSFKPKTMDYKGSGNVMKETSGDKCIDLYSKVAIGSIRDKKTKTSNEYQYERQK